MAFEGWSHFGGFWVTSVVTLPKCISIIFTADIFFDMTQYQSAIQKWHQCNPGNLRFIWLNISVLFYFAAQPFWGAVRFSSGVSGAGSLMHGNMELSVFWRLAEIRQRYGFCTGSNLKQIPLGVGVGGVKKVRERGKGGLEVARKGNIVNPLSVWRCLFLSLFLSFFLSPPQ